MSVTLPAPSPIYVADTSKHLGNAVDPQPRDVILCTYPDTLDGWLAAWVVRGIARQYALHFEFQLISHKVGSTLPDVTDRNWIAIGGTGPWSESVNERGVLLVGVDGGSDAIPFAKWERSIPFGVVAMVPGRKGRIHTTGSLTGQMYAFFHAARAGFEKRPRLIDYLEDASKPSPQLNGSVSLIQCAESYFPMDFQTLDKLVEAADDRRRREMMFVAGQAIRRYIDQQVSSS